MGMSWGGDTNGTQTHEPHLHQSQEMQIKPTSAQRSVWMWSNGRCHLCYSNKHSRRSTQSSLGSQFGRFWSRIGRSLALGPWQHIMVGAAIDQNCSPDAKKGKRKRKRQGSHNPLQEQTHSDLKASQGSPFLKVPSPTNGTTLGAKPKHMCLHGTFQIQL